MEQKWAAWDNKTKEDVHELARPGLSLAGSPDVKYKHECSVRRVTWQKQPGWVSVSKRCYRTVVQGREGKELMHEGKEPTTTVQQTCPCWQLLGMCRAWVPLGHNGSSILQPTLETTKRCLKLFIPNIWAPQGPKRGKSYPNSSALGKQANKELIKEAITIVINLAICFKSLS